MYLRFEDWSTYLYILDNKGIPHGDRIIKVFASLEDPREISDKKTLTVEMSDGSAFKPSECFDYGERGSYSGKDLEEYLEEKKLPPEAKEVVRALFRFSNRPDLRFCQTGMSIYDNEGKPVINHPMEDMDGIRNFHLGRATAYDQIHLDIFNPQSLEHLEQLIQFSNPEHILADYREIVNFRAAERQRSKHPEH